MAKPVPVLYTKIDDPSCDGILEMMESAGIEFTEVFNQWAQEDLGIYITPMLDLGTRRLYYDEIIDYLINHLEQKSLKENNDGVDRNDGDQHGDH